MEKIIYPGMKQDPVKPVKLEGVPEKKVTYEDIVDARDSYVAHSYFLTEKRHNLLIKFAKERDSVIESPAKNATLQELQQQVHFMDAVIRRTLDLWRAADVLLEVEAGTIVLDERLTTLISVIPQARKAVVELIGKDLNETSAEETMVVTLFNEYRMFHKTINK